MEKRELLENLYNINLEYLNNLNISDNIKFGTELEFNNADFYLIKNKLLKKQSNGKLIGYTLEKEISITKEKNKILYGGELITPINSNNVHDWKELKTACSILNESNACIDDNCGTHIHIDRNIFKNNYKYFLNFMKMWALYEKIIYLFSCGRSNTIRSSVQMFSREIGNDFYIMIKNHNYNSYEELYRKVKEVISKKEYAIRIPNNYNTIEIRIPNGTINPEIIQNNINFFINLILYSANNNFDSEFIDWNLKSINLKEKTLFTYKEVDINKALELSDLIFNNNLDKMRFLKQYFKIFNKEDIKKLSKK